jgi:hypothetical protein
MQCAKEKGIGKLVGVKRFQHTCQNRYISENTATVNKRQESKGDLFILFFPFFHPSADVDLTDPARILHRRPELFRTLEELLIEILDVDAFGMLCETEERKSGNRSEEGINESTNR